MKASKRSLEGSYGLSAGVRLGPADGTVDALRKAADFPVSNGPAEAPCQTSRPGPRAMSSDPAALVAGGSMRHTTALLRGLVCLLALTVSALTSPRVQAETFTLNPQATYLVTGEVGLPPALSITLGGPGLSPGDIIQLQPLGTVEFCGEGCTFPASLIGAFTSGAAPSAVNVKPAGPPIVTPPTAVGFGTCGGEGSVPTDILGDFGIPAGGLTVVRIPPGATTLWVALNDCFYADNFSVGLDPLAVTITEGCPAPGVPAALGAPFVCLAPGFTQELYATGPRFFGGVAFAPNGDLLVNVCDNRYFPPAPQPHLRRFDALATVVVHGSSVHPQVPGSPFVSAAACGMANDLSGNVYSNTYNPAPPGVIRINPDTGATLGSPFGGRGNGLGIARDPQTGNLVYVGFDSDIRFVDPGFTVSGVFSIATRDVTGATAVDGIFFEPAGNFLFLAQFPQTLVVMNRDGTIAQEIIVSGQPDGVAFHAVPPKFVVTNNTDGTLTRFDFPGDDYTQAPT